MVAVQQYTDEQWRSRWSDHPDCVDEVIRALCIYLNDLLPDGEREAVIGPHLFAPVGTNNPTAIPERAQLLRKYLRAFGAPKASAGMRFHGTDPKMLFWADQNLVAERPKLSADVNFYYLRMPTDTHARMTFETEPCWNLEALGPFLRELAQHIGCWPNRTEIYLKLILDLCAIGTPVEVCPVRSKEAVLKDVCKVG